MASQTETETERNVVDFLIAQHHEVKKLFAVIEREPGGDTRKAAFEELVRMLAVHETAEEEVVYPVVKSDVPRGEAIVEARLEEEAAAKQALAELEDMGVDDPAFMQSLQAFKLKVLEHAMNEESHVFPALRQSQDPETLAEMAKKVEKAEKSAPTHPHPGGPESAIGNKVVGPFVSIADRVRDALRNRGADD